MKSRCAGLALCIFAAGALAEESPKAPTIGQAAPPLAVALLQAPADTKADWSALKGKVTVLEFWATWCGPCVGAISHMNELAEAFKDRPVQFIAITDEKEATIKEFLGR